VTLTPSNHELINDLQPHSVHEVVDVVPQHQRGAAERADQRRARGGAGAIEDGGRDLRAMVAGPQPADDALT